MKWFAIILFCYTSLTARAYTYQEQAVAAVLMGEAWSEGVQGMTAVAEVIHQRAAEKSETPLHVVQIHQGKVHAFSCLNGTTLNRLIRKFSAEPDYQKALQIAATACENPQALPGITNSANHFTRKEEKPYWAKGVPPVAIIGHHAFYRLEHY